MIGIVYLKNPNAIELLKENQNKIHWCNLSRNPNSIELLKENQDKIDWFYLSMTPNAILLLNKNKINWLYIYQKIQMQLNY